MRFRDAAAAAVAVLTAGVGTAGLLAPARVAAGIERTQQWLGGLPRPLVLVAGAVAVLVVWIVTLWVLARGAYWVWKHVGGHVWWIVGTVVPDSPLVKFAAGVMVLLVVVILIVGALPVVLDGPDSTTDGDAIDYAQELSQEGLTDDWGDVVEGDTTGGPAACQGEYVDGPDTDGDGLPDRWERAGATPSGVELPGADPRHKDLYVQVNYGDSVDPLSDRERDQLREIWVEMPVENPDGETGIDIHVDDSSDRAGPLGEAAVFESTDEYDRYYTGSRLGERECIYHQVVYGRLKLGDTVGHGSMPGYATIVEGRQTDDYGTTYAPRVGVTTHELLHNVAGRVDGRSHTASGWLASGSTDEYLSTATARELNGTGLFGPVG